MTKIYKKYKNRVYIIVRNELAIDILTSKQEVARYFKTTIRHVHHNISLGLGFRKNGKNYKVLVEDPARIENGW